MEKIELFDEIKEIFCRRELGKRGEFVDVNRFLLKLERGDLKVLDLYGEELRFRLDRRKEVELLLKWYKRGIIVIMEVK